MTEPMGALEIRDDRPKSVRTDPSALPPTLSRSARKDGAPPYFSASGHEGAEVLVAGADAGDRVAGRLVLFDEVVFDVQVLCGIEDGLPVDVSVADFSEMR